MINQHRSTLIFVNTRRLAERISPRLRELLGDEAVAGHHGSLSRERRLNAEQRLKNGQLKAIVATASLGMGIDIGCIDLVCQIGSPRSISTFLQRVGRSGHSLGLLCSYDVWNYLLSKTINENTLPRGFAPATDS